MIIGGIIFNITDNWGENIQLKRYRGIRFSNADKGKFKYSYADVGEFKLNC